MTILNMMKNTGLNIAAAAAGLLLFPLALLLTLLGVGLARLRKVVARLTELTARPVLWAMNRLDSITEE